MKSSLSRLACAALLLLLGLLQGGCGGGRPPPDHPPKIEPVRPTVEKPPPAPGR